MNTRLFSRITFEHPVAGSMELQTGKTIPVLLVNISRGGAHLAFSGEHRIDVSIKGLKATIEGLPADLVSLGVGDESSVCWSSPERCGIRFDEELPVPDSILKIIVRDL